MRDILAMLQLYCIVYIDIKYNTYKIIEWCTSRILLNIVVHLWDSGKSVAMLLSTCSHNLPWCCMKMHILRRNHQQFLSDSFVEPEIFSGKGGHHFLCCALQHCWASGFLEGLAAAECHGHPSPQGLGRHRRVGQWPIWQKDFWSICKVLMPLDL